MASGVWSISPRSIWLEPSTWRAQACFLSPQSIPTKAANFGSEEVSRSDIFSPLSSLNPRAGPCSGEGLIVESGWKTRRHLSIRIILLHADSALDELSSGESAVDSLAAIRDAAEKAITLGQQLMAFSSKQVLQTEVLNLNYVTADTKTLVQRLIGDDVTVTFNPGSGLCLVKADRGQLVQVMMNLAVNSRDAMPQGGAFIVETANVEFDESGARLNPEARPGAYVMLVAKDTGHGMDMATQARIFEPFFTTKAIGRGTGLGLSVVYGIVRKSGGFSTGSSELGHGTEVKIYLPAVLEIPKPILQSEHGPVRGGSETILLVEDESALQQKICEVMERAGYQVLVAGDGDEGFRLAIEDAQQIHLLLTDVVMPNMSGARLAEHLRRTRPDTKTLYM